MRTELLDASYVSEMFIAYVSTNKIPPEQIEDVLGAITRGLRVFSNKDHIEEGSLRETILSNGATMKSNCCRTFSKPFKSQKELLLYEMPANKRRSKCKRRGGLQQETANGCSLDRDVTTQEPEPGDEVVLRTGGAVMTVLGSDDEQPRELLCAWFDERRGRCQGTFHADLLRIVE
jgi:uncharacterized protein YodC (DUF2158 family)